MIMQVSVSSVSNLERRLEVSLPASRVGAALDQRLREVAQTVRLKGFRPGKAPMTVVRQQFGQQVRTEVFNELLRSSFFEATQQQNLRPAADPRIEQFSEEPEAGIRYVAVVEIFPEITIQPLSGVTLERYAAQVNEDDIEAMLESMRRQAAEFVEADKAAVDGDQITIDFEGTVGGEAFEGGSAQGVKVVLGRGQMLKDFEDGLRGRKAGESPSLMVSFPDTYPSEKLAGKTAFFDVKVLSVAESRLPEIDDKFCALFGVTEGGIEALKTAVRESMQSELDNAIKTRLRNQVLGKVLDANPVEVPKAMVAEEVAVFQEEIARRTGNRVDPALPVPEDVQLAAHRRAGLGLIAAELAKMANLTLDRERLNARIDELAAGSESPSDVRRQILQSADTMRRIESMTLQDQLIDWVISQAMVIEVPGAAA
ncbi:MAG: trigger factor [Gammaproteobacteria bacterium]|nr:trigger factor [Gammaproteobacteria bacterium]